MKFDQNVEKKKNNTSKQTTNKSFIVQQFQFKTFVVVKYNY